MGIHRTILLLCLLLPSVPAAGEVARYELQFALYDVSGTTVAPAGAVVPLTATIAADVRDQPAAALLVPSGSVKLVSLSLAVIRTMLAASSRLIVLPMDR